MAHEVLHNDQGARFLLSCSFLAFSEHSTGSTTTAETIIVHSGWPKGGKEWYKKGVLLAF